MKKNMRNEEIFLKGAEYMWDNKNYRSAPVGMCTALSQSDNENTWGKQYQIVKDLFAESIPHFPNGHEGHRFVRWTKENRRVYEYSSRYYEYSTVYQDYYWMPVMSEKYRILRMNMLLLCYAYCHYKNKNKNKNKNKSKK